MKKMSIRNFKTLLVICLIAMYGCEKEESFHNEEKAISKKVTLNELPFIKKSLEDKKNTQSNKDGSINYLDAIIGDEILQISESGTNSYTFALSIEEPENQLTNLLIVEENNNLQYYLVIYRSMNMPTWKEDLLNHRSPSVEATIEIRSLSDNKQRYTIYTSGCSVNVSSFTCPSGMHSDNSGTDCIYERSSWSFKITKMSVPCGREEGGGGGGAGTTSPAINNAAHLASLRKITNDASLPYRSKVTILRESLSNTNERGFEFKKNNNGSIQAGIEVPSTSTGAVFGPPSINTLVRMHSHHNNLDPVFSAQDFSGMAEFYVVKNDLGAEDDDEITSLMVTRTGAFGLKIDNIEKVWSLHQYLKIGNNETGKPLIEDFINSYKDRVINKTIKSCNGTCNDAQYIAYLEANVINWLGNWDTGLAYYKGTINTDNTYTWTRLN